MKIIPVFLILLMGMIFIFQPSGVLLYTNISSTNDHYHVKWIFTRMTTVKVVVYFYSLKGDYMYTPYRLGVIIRYVIPS